MSFEACGLSVPGSNSDAAAQWQNTLADLRSRLAQPGGSRERR